MGLQPFLVPAMGSHGGATPEGQLQILADQGISIDALLQRREISFQRFDPKNYAAGLNPSDADLEAYYKANEAQFRTAERATIEYVVLELEALKKGIPVPEDDLRKYYEQNEKRYSTPEERRASHILVKADAGSSADDRAKAKAKAEQEGRDNGEQEAAGAKPDFAAAGEVIAQAGEPEQGARGGPAGRQRRVESRRCGGHGRCPLRAPRPGATPGPPSSPGPAHRPAGA